MRKVDTVTLGAGGGAYPAAFALPQAGRSVVMVDDKGVMSGNCLAEGCVPSKAVREVTELVRRLAKGADLGLGGPANVDFGRVMAHKDRVQRTRYEQHARELDALGGRVELVKGVACLVGPHEVEVQDGSSLSQIRAEHVIVATGAAPVVLPIPGAELCVTSHDLFAYQAGAETLPRRLAVVGGGYIGLEVACMWHALGAVVTVVEAGASVLEGMDPGFVSLLAAGLPPGIKVELDASVREVRRSEHGLEVRFEREGSIVTVEADQVLMAVGRHPVIPDGALELGLELDGRALAASPAMQTRLPRVYSVGDVNGQSMLFHAAVRESLVAAHNILAGDRPVDRMDLGSVPTTVFTYPEASYVGSLRGELEAAGVGFVEGAYALAEDSRAQILDEPYGEIRLFFEERSLRLLGGWVVGVDAAQLVGEIGVAIASGMGAFELARFADQHPMAAEGISKAARSVAG